MNPPKYIGKTALHAANLWKQIPKLQTSTDPDERRYLFTGPPGLGKTNLAEHFAAALSGDTFEHVHARMSLNVDIINGQSCCIEVVRRWQELGLYRPMFGGCRVIIVDEIDATSSAALNELRSYLDRLPVAVVFIGTTNKKTHELQEQLQSRFKVCAFEKIPDAAIHEWLVNEFGLPSAYAWSVVAGVPGRAY